MVLKIFITVLFFFWMATSEDPLSQLSIEIKKNNFFLILGAGVFSSSIFTEFSTEF